MYDCYNYKSTQSTQGTMITQKKQLMRLENYRMSVESM